jgi:hypothetical protein
LRENACEAQPHTMVALSEWELFRDYTFPQP